MFAWLRKKNLEELTADLLAPGSDDKTRLRAYNAALKLGERRDPKAIPALTKAMVGSSRSLMIGQSVKYVGVAAAQALAAIGTDEALQALKRSFRSENHGAREVAAAALRRRGITVPNPNASWKRIFVTSKNEIFYDQHLKIPNAQAVVAFAIDADSDGYLRIVEFEVTDMNGESAVLTADQAKALQKFFEASDDYNFQWQRMSPDLRRRILG
jgi:HEAT repeat protein